MAFRTFRSEAYYEAPAVGPDATEILRAYQNYRAGKVAEQQRRKDLASQYELDLSKGFFESDQKVLDLASQEITKSVMESYLRGGNGPNDWDNAQKILSSESFAHKGKLQLDLIKELEGDINSTNDLYFNKSLATAKLRLAGWGDGNLEVTADTRGERLSKFMNRDTTDEFLFDKKLADFIKEKPLQKTTVTRKGDNYAVSEQVDAKFLNDKRQPEVTDDHAREFLGSDSDGRVHSYYDAMVVESFNTDIAAMKAKGNVPENAWMQNLDDDEIRAKLIQEKPEESETEKKKPLNTVDKRTFAERKLDAVKYDLNEKQAIDQNVSTDYTTRKVSTAAGTDENFRVSYSWKSSEAVAFRPGTMTVGGEEPAGKPTKMSGPGGELTYKNQAIEMDINAPIRANLNTGKVEKNVVGYEPLNLTGFHLQIFNRQGEPQLMEAGSADEFIERIQRIPLNKFDPGNEGSYRDQMSIAFTGYSINRTSLIGQINSYSKELSNNIEGLDKQISNHKNEYDRLATKKELTDAESKKLDQYTKEIEKFDDFTAQQDNVNQVNDMIETGASTEQITAAINRNNIGVQQIQKNQLFEATSESMGRLKATTGGFDLRDKKSWSPEMIAIGKAYNQRVQEAKEAGYKDKHRTTDVEDLGGIKLQESYKDASGKKLTIDELKRQGISKGRIRGLKAIEATDDEIVPALQLKLKIKYIAYDGETYTLEQLKADGFSETMIRLAVVRGTLK